MKNLKSIRQNQRLDAVSAVIGVMLMLSLVIILAAVVSMYAGSVMSLPEKTPEATLDCSIRSGSSPVFEIQVVGVSTPIRSADIKIQTSWSTQSISGITYGGNTTIGSADGSLNNTDTIHMPYGVGPGVLGESKMNSSDMELNQAFGVYTLQPGTVMRATGSKGMTALLGDGWEHLKSGDLVKVKILYPPTNGVLFDKTVVVIS